MNLLPPFHSEAEPGKDFAAIMGKIHRFSVKGSKFLHDVTVKPFATNMKQNAMREDMKSQPPEDDSSKLNIDPATLTADIKQLLEGGEIQMNFNNYLLALFKEDSKPPGQSQIEERLANNNESSIILSIYPMNEFEETYRIIKLLNPSLFESFIWWSVVESILDEGPAQLYEYYKRYHAELTETYGYRSPTPRFV
ncbi:hypothetical protein V9T40_000827 [Parthenolecanium corni]|uniref:Uncharacterized protein n=1 Tax=Parthenolecanium corni TaxID=536013 RepID=A0AAN9Y241_9HEMI